MAKSQTKARNLSSFAAKRDQRGIFPRRLLLTSDSSRESEIDPVPDGTVDRRVTALQFSGNIREECSGFRPDWNGDARAQFYA